MSDNQFKDLLKKAHEFHIAGDLDRAFVIYNRLLNKERDHPHLLYLIADILLQRGETGVAYHLLTAVLTDNQKHAAAWNALGICHKIEGQNQDAEICWQQALLHEPGQHDALVNMATLYSDSGQPDKALEYSTLALASDPNCKHARWNHALALLTKRKWREGWEYHEARREQDKHQARDVGQPWDGVSRGTILVHGEQGIGDEIMFLSCLPDLIERMGAENITVECNAKVVPLVRQSFPVKVIPAVDAETRYDWVIPLGSLPRLFRNNDADFPGTPYIKPNPALVAEYKAKLALLGPGPYVGYSWHGGYRETRIIHRSIACKALPRLGRQRIAIQYGPFADEDAKECGLTLWPEACGNDTLEHQAALIAALDLVITVCTAIVHVAGAMGKPCWVMVPANPSWRYGIEGDMPWYKSVRLFRQKELGGWDFVKSQINAVYMREFLK